ncbi:MAG: thioredoxin family protein [Marinoscillum sp.]
MEVDLATDNDFKEKLAANDKVVVKYYADWCGNCRLFSPKFKRLSNEDRFGEIAFLDVNAEQSPEARKAGGVSNLPYFAIFKGGEFVEGFAGSKEEAVVDLINKLN